MQHSGAGDLFTLAMIVNWTEELCWVEIRVKFSSMNCQVKDLLLQRCLEVEQTAREQATDNAILDQISKVILH